MGMRMTLLMVMATNDVHEQKTVFLSAFTNTDARPAKFSFGWFFFTLSALSSPLSDYGISVICRKKNISRGTVLMELPLSGWTAMVDATESEEESQLYESLCQDRTGINALCQSYHPRVDPFVHLGNYICTST
jgi:hypothetical protein